MTIHQVLHFLDEPDRAIAEAARLLRPGGRLVIIDLAPHSFDYLREDHAHVRLGFSHQTLEDWLKKSDLELLKAVDLRSGKTGSQSLDVTIWIAKDQRLLIANEAAASTPFVASGRA